MIVEESISIQGRVLGHLVNTLKKQRVYVPLLNADLFEDQRDKNIFLKLQEGFQNNQSVDIGTLLHSKNIDNKYLVSLVANDAGFNELWIEIIHEEHRKKTLASKYQIAAYKLGNDDLLSIDIIDDINLLHSDLLSHGRLKTKSKKEILEEFDDLLMHAKDNSGRQGISVTGIPALDNSLNGLEKGDLIVIGARPSVGKSLLASNIVCESIKANLRTVIWTLEMKASSYIQRVFSNLGNIDFSSIRNGSIELDDKNLNRVKDLFFNSRVEIIDKHGVNVDQVCTEIIQLNALSQLDCLVIDYGGLIRPAKHMTNKSTNDQFGYTSGRLKQLAMELGIPIVMLWQLNRDVEKRNPSIPTMSDLRSSGEVEQDADKIVFIYRPEVHDQLSTYKNLKSDYSLPDNVVLFKVDKNRNGESNHGVHALFYKEHMKFEPFKESFI